MNSKDLHNLIFLDWDDTLIPTTWLGENGFLETDVKNNKTYTDTKKMLPYSKSFKEYLLVVKKFITTLRKYGTIIILTGSGEKWISMSSMFIGEENLIKDLVMCHTTNKTESMEKIIGRLFLDQGGFENVISIGDGENERSAILHQMRSFTMYWNKCIKFVENPSLEILIGEMKVVINEIESVINMKCDFDGELYKVSTERTIMEERSKSVPIDFFSDL